jgi:hypothetical protein
MMFIACTINCLLYLSNTISANFLFAYITLNAEGECEQIEVDFTTSKTELKRFDLKNKRIALMWTNMYLAQGNFCVEFFIE